MTSVPDPAGAGLIYAMDYLVAADPAAIAQDSMAYAPNAEGLVLRLFGVLPDYANPEFERLWQRINANPPAAVWAYCREQGVDVLDGAGQPVPPWRDIAVLLRAREAGLVRPAV